MQTTPEANGRLENALRDALGEDADRATRREAASHLHAAAQREARRDGADAIEARHVDAALARLGGPSALAQAFASPDPAPGGLGRRALAYLLDVMIVYGAMMTLWALTFLAFALAGHGDSVIRPTPFQFIDWDDVPWGGARGADLLPVATNLLVGLGALAAPILYFAWFEARRGCTPGKKALDLRVRAEDGRPLGFGRALLRSVPKALPLAPLLLVDALLAARRRPLRRATDRALGVVVVEAAPAA